MQLWKFTHSNMDTLKNVMQIKKKTKIKIEDAKNTFKRQKQ